MKKLTLKNYFIYQAPHLSLNGFLLGLLLHGKESRARNKFIKMMAEHAKEIEDERHSIVMEYCKKGKDEAKREVPMLYFEEPLPPDEVKKLKPGQPPFKRVETIDPTKGTNYAFPDDKAEEKFKKDWDELLREEFVIDVTPSVSECIYTVRDLVLNSTKDLSGD